MMIKAIETVYNGYRFRSRLEARWAVFFDALGIQYEYELEGFDLGAFGWYLPDFWLPQVNMWAEVKAGAFAKDERHKCEALALETKHPVLMLEGAPAARNYWACELEWFCEDVGPDFTDTRAAPTRHIMYMDYLLDERHRYWKTESRFYASTGVGPFEVINSQWNDHPVTCICEWCDPHGAIRAARQARFEHGEQPVTAEMLEAV